MERMMTAGAVSLAAMLAASAATAQRVESTARTSRAGVEQSGGMSLEKLATLPTEIAPFPVTFQVITPKALKDHPRIAIPCYSIGFIRTGEAKATSGGVGSSMISRSSAIETYLAGIDEQTYSDLAEEAYQDLVARFKAAGFDVVPGAELKANPLYAALKPQPLVSGGKGKIDSRAEKGWTIHGAKSLPLINGLGFNPSTTGMMGLMGPLMTLSKVSLATNAVMIIPQLGIDYSDMESSGQKTWGGSSTVSAETRFSINARSNVRVQTRNMGSLNIKGSVGTAEPFAVLQHTQDKSDSANLAGAFAMMGMGNMYRQKNVYAVQANEARYIALTRAAYRGFNAATVAEVKKVRG